MLLSHSILAAGWILFCICHSVFASLSFKKHAERKMGRQYRFYRVYYTTFALVSFAIIMIYLFLMNSYKLFTTSRTTMIGGSIIAVFGLVIMSICIVKYFMQVSGLKGVIKNRPANDLMITGIHKVVRHPLYAGTFIFIWGLLILLPYSSLFIADTIITIYTLIGLQFEEKKLEREFGEAYKMYKEKVPMIIPGFSW